jgi:hypothetical protein
MPTPTLQEIRDAYLANAGYEEANDITMARAFVTACRQLLIALPSNMASDGQSASHQINEIRQAMQAAREWINSQAQQTTGNARVNHPSFERFRQ